MNKSSPDEDSINCIIVGTEHKTIYILDSEAFTILATVILIIFKNWPFSRIWLFENVVLFKT